MGIAAATVAEEALAPPPGLFESCEATFNIDIEPDEAEGARTVGDLYDLIRWKCQSERLGDSACGVADAYLALRRYLAERGLAARPRPTSALGVIFGADPKAEWTALRRHFGKGVPGLTLSEREVCAMSMVMALGLSGGVFYGLYIGDLTRHIGLGLLAALGIVGTAFGMVLLYGILFARTIPAELKTLADLARAAAAHKDGHRSLRAAPRKPAEMWEALSEIVRRETGCTGPITSKDAVKAPLRA